MKKSGYEPEEVRNHGLKGPRCTGVCPQTLGKFEQKIGYRGKCIKHKKLGGEKEKMENKIVLFSVLAVLALFALPSVSAAPPAAAVYFDPEDSIGKFGDDTHVQVMINASVSTLSTGMDIFFDPECVNITDVNFTGNAYFQEKGWTHWGNYVRVGAKNSLYAVDPGVNLVSTLTLQCVNESDCTSDLGFGGTLEIGNYPDYNPVYTEWHNGTFTCNKTEKPDLVISDKYETLVNGSLMVTYTVANKGAGDADASNTSISVDGFVV